MQMTHWLLSISSLVPTTHRRHVQEGDDRPGREVPQLKEVCWQKGEARRQQVHQKPHAPSSSPEKPQHH